MYDENLNNERAGEGMLFFINKREKVDERGIAKLLYKDVSTDSWDRAMLTKYTLDFSNVCFL